MLPHYEAGRHLLLDVTVVSSLQAGLVDRAAELPGHALQHRHAEKWRKYGETCQAEGMVFRAMTFEVLGGMHEATVSTVKRLGQSLARAGGAGGGGGDQAPLPAPLHPPHERVKCPHLVEIPESCQL